MDTLAWLLLESTLALGSLLFVMLFVFLVHWRKTLKPRPFLISLGVAGILLVVQSTVVTRREHADRIMKGIETAVLDSRVDSIRAALASGFRIRETDWSAADFVEVVRDWMRVVDVRTLRRRALRIEGSLDDRFEIYVSYMADVAHRSYSGTTLSRWIITFTARRECLAHRGDSTGRVEPADPLGLAGPRFTLTRRTVTSAGARRSAYAARIRRRAT